MYRKGNPSTWSGRKDPGSTRDVWHQTVTTIDLNKEEAGKVCFLGFCSDIGVKRNLGRPGAVNGPEAIRKAMVNLAVHFEGDGPFDGGDVVVSGDQLEQAQQELAGYVTRMVSKQCFPILLGGGHEISYGHVKGVLDANPEKKVGVINFDPHFDLRQYPQGAHSGSWATQLFDEYTGRFQYLPVGINPAVNIEPMFDLMRKNEQSWISMDELLGEDVEELTSQIHFFIDSVDQVVVTLDLDVFSAGVAPGVSAANPYGILPHHLKPIFKEILSSPKIVSFDVAEMSPSYDDGRTAKLAASFIYDVVMSRLT